MSLKNRYASFLLLVLALLITFCVASVYFISKAYYLLTAASFIVLYLITYQVGKRFSKIFLTLSFLRDLRKNDGILSLQVYENFIDKALGSRRSSVQITTMKNEILEILTKEGVVMVQDAKIILIS